jgi:hypothetical protein
MSSDELWLFWCSTKDENKPMTKNKRDPDAQQHSTQNKKTRKFKNIEKT